MVGLIACKDTSLFEAFSCPWTPSSTFDKLLEIERLTLRGWQARPVSTAGETGDGTPNNNGHPEGW